MRTGNMSSADISRAQVAYEARLDRELEKLMAEDEDYYCGGDCETCKVPYCNISEIQNEVDDNEQ